MSAKHYTYHPVYDFFFSTKEVWRTVKGYNGLYKVSTWGRVKSLDRCIPNSSGPGTRVMPGRILKAKPGADTYPRVGLSKHGIVVIRRLHVLVLETFIGSCPDGMECRHLDGKPENNRLENLAWGTPTENQRDRAAHGTGNIGSRNNFAKTTEVTVKLIKKLAARGLSRRTIASQVNLSYGIITSIVSGRNWKHA